MDRCSTCNGGPFVPPSPIHEGTRLVAFGEMGGKDEAAAKRGFWGVSGKEFRKALRFAGFHVDSAWPNDRRMALGAEDVAFTNAILCRANDQNRFPGYVQARACLRDCQSNLFHRGKQIPWLACGANAIEALTGLRFSKFLDVRGSFLPVLEAPDKYVVATVHPAFIVRGGKENNPDGGTGKAQSSLFPFLGLDARRATETKRPFIPRLVGRESYRGQPLVAIDIEGGYNAPISLVGFSWEAGTAYVAPWNSATIDLLRRCCKTSTPVFHNAAYDIPALEAEGVKISSWVDTINTAALINPSVKLGLQAQVLTYVPGSVTWKGLIDHKKGIHARTPQVALYRKLWAEVFQREGRPIPSSDEEWFVFYNSYDVAGTLGVALAHRRELEAQGRMGYYREVMQPLQEPLLRMGQRGMPVDLNRMAHHRRACERIERMAQKILDRASQESRAETLKHLETRVKDLEAARETERANGLRAFSCAKELTSLRTKLRSMQGAAFKGKSTPQRIDLLYSYLGLPEMRKHKTGNLTTDEESVNALLLRLKKGTIKPKNATVAEAMRVCKALIAISVWGTWRRGFLELKVKA